MCVPGLAAYLRAADVGASDVEPSDIGPAAIVLIPDGPVEGDRPVLATAQVTAPATAGVTAPGTTATEGRA
ncbi:hypothetical protein FHX71_001976 [Promicromonospora sukumoe]|uniref:Uncharacterized protein n=1 Tax=Promicromonospora sukumoe TaxID=88382 RepID=A0A7W3PE03_9MICO|nr:hypothetical protein [Promicromonospora sukumoe]